MSDGGRLELDDKGGVVEGSGLSSAVVDLDDPSAAVVATAFGFDSSHRAVSWAPSHRRPVAALLLTAMVVGICWAARPAPPPSPDPASVDASAADSGSSAVFRDPSSGAIVMAYSPSTRIPSRPPRG